jgi:hypothetical protein
MTSALKIQNGSNQTFLPWALPALPAVRFNLNTPTMSNGPSFAELEAAAGAVIGILKTFPEFSGSRIAVIGGLGLWSIITL